MAASILTQAIGKKKTKCKILGFLGTPEQYGWPGQVYLPCEAKKLHVYMKISTRTVTPTCSVYLNQGFVINKRSRSCFTLKYDTYQKSVLSNVDLWLQISPLHSSSYCIFPRAGVKGQEVHSNVSLHSH